jgi:hypothetical protein
MTTVSLTCIDGRASADPLSTQPLIGVAAEYASNPDLIASGARSESHAAVFVDLPVNYDLDKVHFSVIPRVRYGGASGYSSVTSNYYHLDASAQFNNDFGSLTCAGTLYRDSSLLYAGELANGVGVRRDTATVDLNWQRAVSERLQFQFDGNTARTLYAQNTALSSLVDYRYSSLSPALAYSVNERDTLRLMGSVGRYQSLDGFTESNSDNLQIGFDHRLSDLWKLGTSAGYSKSINQYHYIFGTFQSAQKGGIYSANLTRQGEAFSVIASATRALTPTGFAFLSRQDSDNASLTDSYSERWTFGANATWQNIADPVTTGGTSRRRYYNGDFSSSWRWTEHWTLTLHLTKIGQQYTAQLGRPPVNPTSDGVRLDFSRQFYRTNQ